MTKKLGAVCAFVLTGTLVFFAACQNSAQQEINHRTQYVVRVFPAPEHGTLRVSEARVPEGAWVTVYVNPAPGYALDDSTLKYLSEITGGGNASNIAKTSGKYQFSTPSPGANVTITGTFVPKPGGKFTVSVDNSIASGFISPEPLYANPGDPVTLTLIPDAGYDLKAGTLSYRVDEGMPVPVSEDLPYRLSLPAGDITVSAEFEEKDFAGLMASARKYLSAGKYDNAASFYKEAYKKDTGDPEALLYSTFAELGELLLDTDVRSVLSSLYFSSLPGNLDDWVCDGYSASDCWYMTYIGTVDIPEDAVLPKINQRISGFATPFGDFAMAQASPKTRQSFNNNIFWGLISSYKGGFNSFIDNVHISLFGDTFEALARRADSFPADGKVLLNDRLKQRFKLEEIYGPGDTYIGKAELDYIFSNLRAVKAAFDYLSAYDWTIDLRPWMVNEILITDGLDEVLDKVFTLATQSHKDYWNNVSGITGNLPFKNNFMTVRNAAALGKSKAELSKALNMANASLGFWYGSAVNPGAEPSRFAGEAKAKYQYAKDGISSAKAALDGSGVFHFPKKLPKPGPDAVWPGASDADYGVDVAKFFTPGIFSPRNLFTTELGGRAPSLYKIKWYEDRDAQYAMVMLHEGVLIDDSNKDTIFENSGLESNVSGTNRAPYGIYSFEMNTKALREIFPKGFEQSKYQSKSADGIPKTDAAYLYDVFPNGILIWPFQQAYFKGTNKSALNLYNYYHKR
ncbi:MAG: hypothetical protein LBS97_06730 [Treponema sp.]|jgi:hypothetical protein|nr:hypothetical protein [Treponema sp.]